MFRNPFRKKTEFSGGLRKGQLVRPSINLKSYERMRKINRLLGRIDTNSTGLIQMKQDYWF